MSDPKKPGLFNIADLLQGGARLGRLALNIGLKTAQATPLIVETVAKAMAGSEGVDWDRLSRVDQNVWLQRSRSAIQALSALSALV